MDHILYFIRHGESLGNIQRKFLRPNEDVLTENGQTQVDLLGKFLRDVPLTRIISSDYPRAMSTAAAIVQNSRNPGSSAIKSEERLRERRFGVFDGQGYSEAIKALLKSDLHVLDYNPPEGEPQNEVEARVGQFLEELFSELDSSPEEEERVVIVSHSFALLALMSTLSRSPYIMSHSELKEATGKLQRNASYNKMRVQRKRRGSKGQRRVQVLEAHAIGHLENTGSDTLVKFTRMAKEGKHFQGCIQS